MATSPSPPPAMQPPTSKERKYDRQLRLWAAAGQSALESAHILLINSGASVVGIETLKNLVLPGIGHFTIVDPAVVTEADLGINFFLEEEDLDRFRAEACCRWLKELNPDVEGNFVNEPLETFLTNPSSLQPYTHILVTLPLQPSLLTALADHASKHSIPTFYIHSIGFYASFTLQLPPAFPIVDTHPDPASTQDLRLVEPWPELIDIASSKTADIDSLDDEAHGHIPYLLLILHYLEQWKQSHNGKAPQNFKEKTAFRDLIRTGARTSSSAGEEENYEEATSAVLKSLNPHTPSSGIREVFAAPECTPSTFTPNTASFWLIAAAIKQFTEANGNQLPLPGTLPDMRSKSADYIALQNVYKRKHRSDVAAVTSIVREFETKLGKPRDGITDDAITQFCKSANHVKLLRGRHPHVATVAPGKKPTFGDRASAAAVDLNNPQSLMPLYLALLAYDSYVAAHAFEPGEAVGKAASVAPTATTTANDTAAASTEADRATATSKITGMAQSYLAALYAEAEIDTSELDDPSYEDLEGQIDSVVAEIVRANGAELHNVAAMAGGMVAQEAIKVVTGQYVPVDNTCVVDGVRSLTGVFRL